jgi:hypothetical protein
MKNNLLILLVVFPPLVLLFPLLLIAWYLRCLVVIANRQ